MYGEDQKIEAKKVVDATQFVLFFIFSEKYLNIFFLFFFKSENPDSNDSYAF